MYIVVGTDYSGLGWCKLLKEQGQECVYAYEIPEEINSPEDRAAYALVGEGIVDKMPIAAARDEYEGQSATWIAESNSTPHIMDELASAGERVFMGLSESADLEHERSLAMKMAEESGLDIADMIECKDINEALDYLEQHEDHAYVFKPNDSNLHYMTFVPTHDDDDQANEALREFLSSWKEDQSKGFLLQERKKGVEVCFELWVVKGEPVLATCCFESKRILDQDDGEHCGCSQDVIFPVPIDCVGIEKTVGKTLGHYSKDYTGSIDCNCILSDHKVWFLEVCDRFGYSAHPNLFLNCLMEPFGDFVDMMIDGHVEKYDSMFRKGFGASINLYMEHPRQGWPIIISDKVIDHYYPYDLYKDGSKYKLAGYSNDIGVVCQHGYTIQDAAEYVLDVLHRQRVWFPDLGRRHDLAKTDYPSSPIKRYQACEAMGLFQVKK